MRDRLPLLISTAVMVTLAACAPPAPAAVVTPAPLPDVAVATLSGEPVSVGRVTSGRVAIVTLWATWCDACVRETDALNRLAGSGVEVVAIAVGEEPRKVAEFARTRGLRYVQLVDEGFVFADAVGQRRVPSTLVVDRRGQIVYRGDALDAEALETVRRAAGEGTGAGGNVAKASP